MNRTVNTFRNVVTAIGGQMFNNFLKFICRTAFIYTLGKEYLGISSLYTNILTILSISELGFGSAITYSLYKPLAENDYSTISSLMNFFRKAYRIIGLVILGVGICLMPFLPRLMTGVTDKVNIYLYYLLYLIQTVVSYLFFAYKSTLLIADQKKYLNDIIMYIVQMCMNFIQILVLFLLKSFLVYTIVSILSNIVQNIVVAKVVDKKYPYLKEPSKKLTKSQRKEVFSRVYAMSLYRVSTAIGNATDNLIISANIGVVIAGLYDNYYMIIQIVQKLITSVFQAFTSSLGNLYIMESKEQNEFMFRCLNLLNNWLLTFTAVCFLVLFQPFIELWVGEEYLLSTFVVIIIVLNFATNYWQNVVQIYKDASGLFVRGKYRAVATAILNLIISIFLVKHIGLSGVFLGSIISRLITTWWYDAWLLYKYGFQKSPVKYYCDCLIMLILTGIIYAGIEVICIPISAITWGTLCIKAVLSVLLPNAIYLLLYGKSNEFNYLWKKIRGLIFNKKELEEERDNFLY